MKTSPVAGTPSFLAPMLSADPQAEKARATALRRMRLVATGLLVLAAVVYLATLGRDGGWGFVNAGAEASMVGAIADWFAVTALFRHPLGLPVPHTALVPRRKDDLGKGLEEFVGDNFLSEEIIRERVLSARITARTADWLGHEAHARRVVDEVAEVAAVAIGKVRDSDVADLVEHVLVPRFEAEPIAPLAGTLLTEVVADGLHHPVVDMALDEVERWLERNEATFTGVLVERAPWWTPDRLNDAVGRRLYHEALTFVADVKADPDHRARAALDQVLSQLADDLLHDPVTAERCERFKDRVLHHPQVTATAVSLWQALRNALAQALAEPHGALRNRLVDEVTGFARRVSADSALQRRFDRTAADAAVFLVDRYGTEVTGVITSTIEKWDGKEAANRIELFVGRDLQFIRINGTVVGGLVGLLIHAVSLLLG